MPIEQTPIQQIPGQALKHNYVRQVIPARPVASLEQQIREVQVRFAEAKQVYFVAQTPDYWQDAPTSKEVHCLQKDTPCFFTLPKPDSTQGLGAEVVSIQKLRLAYPGSRIGVNPQDCGQVTEPNPQGIPPGSLVARVKQLFPPVIINLRTDVKDQNSRTQLNANELHYFQTQGNNVLIFIHGYNEKYGEFAKQIQNITELDRPSVANAAKYGVHVEPIAIKRNDIDNTVCRTLDQTRARFPELNEYLNAAPVNSELPTDLTDEGLNGTESHNWFLHMEDNINRATNQFDGSDYRNQVGPKDFRPYQRIIHVAWHGDVGKFNFSGNDKNSAEGQADGAGQGLSEFLKWLYAQKDQHGERMKINIIAHSLGNRVLLSALNNLDENYDDKIEHIFMWQPAVPNTILSKDASKNQGADQLPPYPAAYKKAKKITVLFNQNDDVLGLPYWLSSYVGSSMIPMINALEDWAGDYQMRLVRMSYMGNAYVADSPEDSLREKMIAQYPARKTQLETLFRDSAFIQCLLSYGCACFSAWAKEKLGISTRNTELTHDEIMFTNLPPLAEKYDVPLALGYSGVVDHEISLIQLGKKLIEAPMTPYAIGHSYMKIPSVDVMKYGYQTYIVSKNPDRGLKKFGNYDVSKFSDYSVPQDNTSV